MLQRSLIEYGLVALAIFFSTAAYEALLIPVLRRYRAGQPILEIGPSWHSKKAGTPTMGGLAFVFAVLTVGAVYGIVLAFKGRGRELYPVLAVLFLALGSAAIGFYDDYLKLLKKENKGLSAAQKYFLQLLLAALFLLVAVRLLGVGTAVRLPFVSRQLALGLWYYPLMLLFITGVINALNLTDGLDGLLSATVSVLGVFCLAFGLRSGVSLYLFFGAVMLGGSVGFLLYNAHPAKVFMGDTGSLFWGGMVAGVGVLTASPITLLLAGGVYVIEAASVILQVIFFKLTKGKRLFRMAPLHHHFEKCGLGERSIVFLFSLTALLFAVLAFVGG
ncbi:MAG: phospho-N-acetylmuramoyl-pentapeptide-transferase [Ruminococcaceae bacterium]|nr:phospho-N-acetylmuramoyl-pentapeptide-transferase [Oscillospiraceae bacterium]